MPEITSLGVKIRALRQRENLSQAKLAEKLKISPSYLNLIEHDRRPMSAPLLIKLAQLFKLDLQTFSQESDDRLYAELKEAFGDPLMENHRLSSADIEALTASSPPAAEAVLHLYRAYHTARQSAQDLATRLSADMALPGVDRSRLPSEEVSDFIQRRLNYFPEMEAAAEALWERARLSPDDLYHGLVAYLHDTHGVTVQIVPPEEDRGAVRHFDSARKILALSESLPRNSRKFQIAHQLAMIEHGELLDRLSSDRGLSTPESHAVCRVAMSNYFAGAMLMPYQRLLRAAREERYDIDLLGNRFGATFEQVCHRLTSLRRPGDEGIPFHFLRVDLAGNISKRFSASGIQLARFGGSCARWNLHTAFLTPGRVCVQLSQMPDGKLYFCIARTVVRGARGHHATEAVYAITLGCEAKHARGMVYADGIDLESPDAAVPIGSTCRLCDRMDCEQRAFPSLQHPLRIDPNARGISFYAPVP